MTGEGSPGLGELARQVRDVLVRFETLGARLEQQFVRVDIFQLSQKSLEQDIRDAETKSSKDNERLSERVRSLEDNLKWVVRLLVSFVLLGVLGMAFTFGKGGG